MIFTVGRKNAPVSIYFSDLFTSQQRGPEDSSKSTSKNNTGPSLKFQESTPAAPRWLISSLYYQRSHCGITVNWGALFCGPNLEFTPIMQQQGGRGSSGAGLSHRSSIRLRRDTFFIGPFPLSANTEQVQHRNPETTFHMETALNLLKNDAPCVFKCSFIRVYSRYLTFSQILTLLTVYKLHIMN